MIDPDLCPPAFIQRVCDTIRSVWQARPRTAVILGSGFGSVTAGIDPEAEFAYHKLPHYPRSTALGHAGRLICGTWEGESVVVMSGRFHLYEGYHETEIALPIWRVGGTWRRDADRHQCQRRAEPEVPQRRDHGCRGAHQPDDAGRAAKGLGGQPLSVRVGEAELLRPRAHRLRASDRAERNFVCQRGVYAGVSGPNYETRAEYRFLRKIGADAVGMSTVPEVIAARHLGLRVLGLSIITNVACPDGPTKTTPEEVCRLAASAEGDLRKIVRTIVRG